MRWRPRRCRCTYVLSLPVQEAATSCTRQLPRCVAYLVMIVWIVTVTLDLKTSCLTKINGARSLSSIERVMELWSPTLGADHHRNIPSQSEVAVQMALVGWLQLRSTRSPTPNFPNFLGPATWNWATLLKFCTASGRIKSSPLFNKFFFFLQFVDNSIYISSFA